jgi:drug/metabolite transporter (DMT)-like permease
VPASVVAALLLYTVLAAATFIVARVALEEFDPLALAQLRFVLAALALAVLVAARGGRRALAALMPPPRDRRAVALLGLLGTPINQAFFLLGLERTTPAHAALLYALTPLLVLALALVRRQERLVPSRALGFVVAFAGVALLLFGRGLAAEGSTLAGDALVAVAVVAWALYTATSRELLARLDPLALTASATAFGALVFLPVGIPALLAQDFARVSGRGWLGLAYIALVTSVATYLIWSWALSRTEASRVAAFSYLQPVAAALLAWVLLGLPLTVHFAVSAAVVLAGVALAERRTGPPWGALQRPVVGVMQGPHGLAARGGAGGPGAGPGRLPEGPPDAARGRIRPTGGAGGMPRAPSAGRESPPGGPTSGSPAGGRPVSLVRSRPPVWNITYRLRPWRIERPDRLPRWNRLWPRGMPMTARFRTVSVSPVAALLLLALAVPAAAQSSRSPRSIEADIERLEKSALGHHKTHEDRGGGRVVDVMIRGSVSKDAIRAMGGEVGTVAGDVTTVRLPLSAAPAIARLPGVQSLRLALPLEKHNDLGTVDDKVNLKRSASPPLAGFNGTNVVVGFVDSGIQYQHDDFKNPDGTTRLLAIWDQATAGTPPPGFSYGNECSQAQINAGTCSETDPDGHGTHVAGTAAGDGSATGNGVPQFKYAGAANKASIVMVKTIFTDTGLIDGVNYIFQKAAALGRPAVVNLSLGTNLGPHDGTTDLELGLQALTGPGRIIVASAGNDASSSTHARLTAVAAADSANFTVPAYSGGPGVDFFLLDGWYEGSDNVRVTLISPTGLVFGPVSKGAVFNSPALGSNPANADGRVYIENGFASTTNGDENLYIEISDVSSAPKPRNGVWKVRITPVSVVSTGKVHFWSYSNLTPTYPEGTFTTRQTSEETVSAPSTADSVISVAAHVTRNSWISSAPGQPGPWGYGETLNTIASFSGSGPRRDGAMKPDLSAPGSAIASTLSTTWAAGGAAFGYDPRQAVDDGVHAVQQGTSMAAPMVTGAVAMMLQQDPDMGPTLARQRLAAGARVDGPVLAAGAVPNKRFGAGKLDLGSVLPNIDTVAPTVLLTRPNGGETFLAGTNEAINWNASDNVAVTSVTLESSVDNGLNWDPLAAGLPNSGTYLWSVPNTVSSQALVRITAFDTQNQSVDQSNAVFAISSNVDSGTPALAFAVHKATPSPFNNATSIGFDLPAVAGAADGTWPVRVRIFNLAGRLVRTPVDAPLPPGAHVALWDGTDDRGVKQAAGVYFIEVATPEHTGRVRAVYLR